MKEEIESMAEKTAPKNPTENPSASVASEKRVLVLASSRKGWKNIRLQISEWNVLFKIDGKKGREDIARALGVSREQLQPIVEKFLEMGLIQEVSPDTAQSRPHVGKPSRPDLDVADLSLELPDAGDPLSMDDLFELSENDRALNEALHAVLQEPDHAPTKTAPVPDLDAGVADPEMAPPAEAPSRGEVGEKAAAKTAPPLERAVLRAEKLVKIYGKRRVVNEVSLQVQQGQVIGLLGPNGAGKTTSFYMITGFISPNSGKIYLDQKDITSLPMYKRARLGMAYLPQEASIFRKLTVEENLLAIMEALGFSRKVRKQRCQELMEELRITHIAKNRGYNLSGGERRRTEIARALVNNPKFILLDEPFAGVDPIAVQDIQNIVVSLKEKNIGILITDHNVQETLSITDHAYLLFEGKVLKEGDSDFIANDPEAQKLYLGEKFRLIR